MYTVKFSLSLSLVAPMRRCPLIFEALEPITLLTRTRGTIPLKGGDRLDWPDEDVRKVLKSYPEKFKLVETSDLWLQAWGELADLTQGIQESDWRFKGIMDLLESCDVAFEAGNWTDFEQLAEKVKRLCEKR